MADYIESWRTRQRANQVISALRKITRDKKASVAQRLEACKLLIDIERERAESDKQIKDLRQDSKVTRAFPFVSTSVSPEINNLAQSA
jgi:hypothetical protein